MRHTAPGLLLEHPAGPTPLLPAGCRRRRGAGRPGAMQARARAEKKARGGGGRAGRAWLGCLALLLAGAPAEAARFRGFLKTPDSWRFLARFCFQDYNVAPTVDPTTGEVNRPQGRLTGTFRFRNAATRMNLLHYVESIDAPGQEAVGSGLSAAPSATSEYFGTWRSVYKSDLSCVGKVKKALPLVYPLWKYSPDVATRRGPQRRTLLQAACRPSAAESSRSTSRARRCRARTGACPSRWPNTSRSAWRASSCTTCSAAARPRPTASC